MCSRYSRKNKKAKVGQKEVQIPAAPQPVIRPTDRASILRAGSFELEVAELRWGLIPSWAKDPKIGLQCINARSETVAEKPAFRDSFARRRCLVPADSFFEWETQGRRKIPWLRVILELVAPVENALPLMALPLVPLSTVVWAKTGATPTNEKNAKILFMNLILTGRGRFPLNSFCSTTWPISPLLYK